MSSDELISRADLSYIEGSLSRLESRIDGVDSRVSTVNDNVIVVNGTVNSIKQELDTLRRELDQFRQTEQRHHNLQNANEKLVRVNQDLDKNFGYYDEVRRTTTGILQATDIGIVHSEKITDVVEEAQIKCPGYWLAPCLVATAAWINDDQPTAQKAVKEAIHRNDEKASLYFGLVSRRSGRNDTATRWMKRYLIHEDPVELHRDTIVIIDAYSAGLFPAGTEDLLGEEFSRWIEFLEAREGFHEEQVSRWMKAFHAYDSYDAAKVGEKEFPYLREYSPTWPELEKALNGARRHRVVAEEYKKLFDTPINQEQALKELDRALSSLVTNFDDEELPLRREKQLYEAIIKFDGDEDAAKERIDLVEGQTLSTTQDFGQLLATVSNGSSQVQFGSLATQKYAIAMSQDWALEAYRKIVAENRRAVPLYIKLKVDDYEATTRDGSDVEQHVADISAMIDKQLQDELDKLVMTPDDEKNYQKGQIMLVIGIACAVLGIIASALLALFAIAALVLIVQGFKRISAYRKKENSLPAQRQKASDLYGEKKDKAVKIVRAVCAEAVDYRQEFQERDAEDQLVTGFLEALEPESYVRAINGSTRGLMTKATVPATPKGAAVGAGKE